MFSVFVTVPIVTSVATLQVCTPYIPYNLLHNPLTIIASSPTRSINLQLEDVKQLPQLSRMRTLACRPLGWIWFWGKMPLIIALCYGQDMPHHPPLYT